MIRMSSVKTRLQIVVYLALLAMIVTCSSDEKSSDEAGERGKVKLPLTVVDGDEAYRIRGTFVIRDYQDEEVWGPHATDETSDSTSIEVDLDPGSYTIKLLDGWELVDRNGEVVEDVTLVSSEVEFKIRPWEVTPIEFEFLIGDVDGDAKITADADGLHSLTGKVTLQLAEPCDSEAASPCGPLSDLDGAEIDFVMMFAIENDGFAGDTRQITTGPVILEFFGNDYLENVVEPALNGSTYSFTLKADDDSATIWFNSSTHLMGEGSDAPLNSTFDLAITGDGNGSPVDGIESLASSGLPPFSVRGGRFILKATSSSTGGTSIADETVSGSGIFYYDRYSADGSDGTGPGADDEPRKDVIHGFDSGTFANASERYILHDGMLEGPFSGGSIASKEFNGRNFAQLEGSKANLMSNATVLDQTPWQQTQMASVSANATNAPNGSQRVS